MYLTPWETWEEEFLRDVAGKMPTAEIMKKLERSASSIQNKASRLNVSLLPQRHRPWTKAEQSLFENSTADEIVESTQRSIYAVRAMRYRLSRTIT